MRTQNPTGALAAAHCARFLTNTCSEWTRTSLTIYGISYRRPRMDRWTTESFWRSIPQGRILRAQSRRRRPRCHVTGGWVTGLRTRIASWNSWKMKFYEISEKLMWTRLAVWFFCLVVILGGFNELAWKLYSQMEVCSVWVIRSLLVRNTGPKEMTGDIKIRR